MSTHDDGGPAFPRLVRSKHNTYENCEDYTTAGGMTLHDYVAVEAMKALIACEPQSYANDLANGYRGGRTVSLAALAQADAFLAAKRERSQ